ncbi:Uncharacterized protein TCM_044502 [Theobroma cacao]|uniref:Uncharacterized protein n=1 Tax=Theobroma cacao TaxID=3641 RepID=A0A061FX72_THECC|nr:Uncharacterized protein TCM_044502 [Theobroma cacao]
MLLSRCETWNTKPSQAKYHGNEGKIKPRGNDPSNNNNAKALGFVPNNFLTSMHILIAVLLKPLSHGIGVQKGLMLLLATWEFFHYNASDACDFA